MAGKRNQLQELRSNPKQPKRCNGCIWGALGGDETILFKAVMREEGEFFLMRILNDAGGAPYVG